MALRRHINKDVPSESQQMDEDGQDDDELDDGDDKDEFSTSLLSTLSTRGTRRKEREQKSKPKEMTEEEMMDLALRLSEQEASVTALQQQEEEEAVMKAIQESMSQSQPSPSSQTQILLPAAEASLRLCSRRKLLYSNGETEPASEERSGAKKPRGENNNRNKKRKRKEEEEGSRLSPLPELPDLSQSQKISSQVSSCSSESVCVLLDSPQSCDSTQIDDCHLGKSPVFPLTGCRAEVLVPRLDPDTLQTCRSSGFVLCSQDSSSPTQKSPSAQRTSPTFPKIPGGVALPESTAPRKSPVFSETGDGEQSPEYLKSPVFGRNTQHETLPSACKASSENSGFMFSSQESLCSSVRPTSCRSRSPVFVASLKSPVASETERGPDGPTERRRDVDPDPAELRESSRDENPANDFKDASVCLQQDRKTDLNPDGRSKESSVPIQSDADKLKETSADWNCAAESELTSDMTLHWSEEDDDVTPVGSPSPVFPEERLVHQADDQPAASMNHVTTAASPGTNGPNRGSVDDQNSSNKRISLRPSTSTSSSTSTQPQPFSTTEQEPQQPISSQGGEGRGAAGGSTVHYYWGIPFCPRGLDPDSYTQVILAQMEVYEKSLKEAQRSLLRKAEWGDPILPEPEKPPSPESPPAESSQQLVPRRRCLRLRNRKFNAAADSPPGGTAEEEEDEKKEEERGKRGEEEEEERNERQEGGGPVDTDDCEVCPETQLSDNDSTQDLMIAANDRAELQPKSPEKPEVEVILQVDSPAGDETQGEKEMMEVDAPAVTEPEGNNPVSSQKETKEEEEEKEERVDPDVEEIKDRRLQRSDSPELELLVVPQSAENNVDCPICQRSFSVTDIEWHAAYCDGEERAEAESRVSLKPRRKRTRKATEEPTDRSDAARSQEKCFICHKAVPLREYSRHTELCIQQQATKSTGKGNLLSALQHTESRDSEAGPSGSRLQTGDVIDLRDDDDDDEEEEEGKEEGGGTGQRFRISDSPIRSFTPISEAGGCLINFRKQPPAKKPSQRRR
ncbi:BRCA1-A complex subunit RAP80 [Scomber scombrus]|uniref:BRCA1-A complex subunit RAP80 n=1 Tax=Scomber scombrus TaxID=13677 RepID=UPI002DD872D3|nr:BRCA1-A complex subunit RAP80 [Scomber scombrus]